MKKEKKRKRAKSAKVAKRTTRRKPAPSTAEQRRDAEHFLETLEATGQIAHEPGPLPPGATHQVESDESGTRRVVRKRYSAF